jgi:hypothetical protein
MATTTETELPETALASALRDFLWLSQVETEAGEVEVVASSTFEDAGLMTRNAGVVIVLDNGQKFQLTIVEA